jgi:hypothetical protein
MTPDESQNPDSLEDERDLERQRKETEEKARRAEEKLRPNPPYTTKHGITAPKFGSAGSGGAENEPGPERD